MTNRPLSPHLQVYRPQLTSVLSIVHRATGIVIAIGAVVIAAWIWSLSAGQGSFEFINDFLASVVGKIFLFAWTACTAYHLCNGVRHLVWDAGFGFELSQAYLSGKVVIAATVVLTLMVWMV